VRTIAALWRNAVARSSPLPAYLAERDGSWVEVSWPDAARRVNDLANGLLALGVKKGDAFAILGDTSLEWALFDYALAHVGAIGAPVYANSSSNDAAYVVGHSESVGILAEDDAQLAKLEGHDLPRLLHRITFADLEELEAHGREFASAHPGTLDERVAQIGEDDLYTYIYTSGTTGPPKGCMITNRNYYEMAAVVDKMPQRFVFPGDVLLLYLPMAHNYGRLIHLQAVYMGYTLAFCSDPLRVGEGLATVRPTVFPSVPRVYEKIHTAVVAKFDEETGARRKLIDWALAVGYRVSKLKQAKQPIPRALLLQHWRVLDNGQAAGQRQHQFARLPRAL